MTDNNIINKKFLDSASNETRNMILDTIANHYGISREDAYEELIDDEAEHLLDYVTGNERAETSVIMQKLGFYM
jgi:hypothetical protein